MNKAVLQYRRILYHNPDSFEPHLNLGATLWAIDVLECPRCLGRMRILTHYPQMATSISTRLCRVLRRDSREKVLDRYGSIQMSCPLGKEGPPVNTQDG